jgi:glycosyltransferase involved in cell wall biosynthesis
MTANGLSVLHLSTYDIVGGAARAAYRLHEGLRTSGVSSRMLVREKHSDDPDVLLAASQPEARLHRAWRKAAPYLDAVLARWTRSDNPTPISPSWLPGPTRDDVRALAPDVVNLHWICGGFVRPEAIAGIAQPIVWTLHDQWAFCGAEHYTRACSRFREGYRHGNRPSGETGLDVNRWVWSRKRRAYRKVGDIAFVAPSTWLTRLATESVLLRGRQVVTIPYGIDHETFRPIDKALAREILRLPGNTCLILFGAFGGLGNPRKGFPAFATAVRDMASRIPAATAEVVIFGSSLGAKPPDLGMPIRSLGYLADSTTLALAYSAADVFVTTASEDNLPLTVMESMACGTPVIGFDVGGVGDLVRTQDTGWLVPAGDVARLATALKEAVTEDEHRRNLGRNARALIASGFTLAHQSEQYRRLYGEMLERRASRLPMRANGAGVDNAR